MSMTSSGQCVSSELYAFGHRDPLAMASFCVLLTETGSSAALNDLGFWEACHQPPLQNKTAKRFVMSSIHPKVSKAAAAAQVTSSSFPTSTCSGWKVVALLLPPRPMGCIHAYGIG